MSARARRTAQAHRTARAARSPITARSRWTRRSSRRGDASFGRAAHPPLLVTLAGDLGAGKTTLVQAICAGYGVTERGDESDVRARARVRGAAIAGLSPRPVSARAPGRSSTNTRLGRDRERAGARPGGVAGARGRPAAGRPRDALARAPAGRSRTAACCYAGWHRVITLVARGVDLRGKRRRARRRRASSPSAAVAMRGREHEER